MNCRIIALLLTAITLCLLPGCNRPGPARGPVRVATTIGILADWARQVGGDRVQVTSMLTGLESPHTYEPRPSDVKQLAAADIVFRVGLGLEEWLDPVIANTGNARLAVVDAAAGVDLIEDDHDHHAHEKEPPPDSAISGHHHSPAAGHPLSGNPHVWLDPENAKIGIDNLVTALIRVDPKGESLYRARQRSYSLALDSLTAEITGLFAGLKDRRLVTFHGAWPYFARRFGLEIVAEVEPIPGQEPSAREVAHLVDLIRRERVRVICNEPQLPSDLPEMLARETGVRLLTLSPLEGGIPGVKGYAAMMRYNARAIAGALQ